LKRKLFGTDGIRGKANIHPMTGEIAMALGRAVTLYFQQKEKSLFGREKPLIIIGKDTRLSCYMLEHAFSAGVCSQGGQAILTGPLPTPGVAFVTQSMRADAGVMISASHNSYEDNGIKIFDRTGHKLPDAVELELEKMILNPELVDKKVCDELGNAKRLDEVIGRYIVQTKNAFSHQYSLAGMRLVIDCANGAGYRVAPKIFEELGAEVIALGVNPNGININEQCGALHPDSCAQNVLKYRADLGICLDGDADRLVMIDEKGEVIDGDQLMAVLAHFLKVSDELDEDLVIGTVMTNAGVENFLHQLGIKLERTQVGDRYIVEKMLETGSIFGGEPSGHLIFKKQCTTGDGILAALKVIECMKYFKKSLSALISEVPLYPQILKNISVSHKIPFEEIPEVMSEVHRIEKEMGKEGRVLLRYSGTEQLARVMVEGKSKDKVKHYCDQIAVTVDKAIGAKAH
jgi:phosphoglucosamine mutase